MTSADIKATVEELERVRQEIRGEPIEQAKAGFYVALLHQAVPALLAELRRLWAIEEAAVSLRDAQKTYGALFELLDAKPSGGEEAKP